MTTTIAPDIAAFAAAVRTQLSDLAPDDIEELTDGLEADLAERLADTPAEELGDPAAYAAELRAAAGHPPRSARGHVGGHGGGRAAQSAVDEFRAELADWRSRWEGFRARRPELTAIVAFVVALRPVWWVFRGLIVGTLLVSVFEPGWSLPRSAFGWLVALTAVVVSVQFGRGRWLPSGGMRVGLAVVNVFLAISAPFIAATALSGWNAIVAQSDEPDQSWYSQEGLLLDGVPVGNIFAYDAAGDPIEQVQLFDANGAPLDLFGAKQDPWLYGTDGTMLVGSPDVAGRAGWNVYPLGHVSDLGEDGTAEAEEITPPKFPFGTVKPLWGHAEDIPAGELAESAE
jgi:hypothetical protein